MKLSPELASLLPLVTQTARRHGSSRAHRRPRLERTVFAFLATMICFATLSCGGKKGTGDDCSSDQDCGSGLVCEQVAEHNCDRVCWSNTSNPGNCAGR
ncbi:MAG TPA: hypothetical protein VGI39_13065 [Polyangiaceae bacterium]|jgi:hypothetical protein